MNYWHRKHLILLLYCGTNSPKAVFFVLFHRTVFLMVSDEEESTYNKLNKTNQKVFPKGNNSAKTCCNNCLLEMNYKKNCNVYCATDWTFSFVNTLTLFTCNISASATLIWFRSWWILSCNQVLLNSLSGILKTNKNVEFRTNKRTK